MQKCVLVAGSQGTIGQSVACLLADKGYRVMTVSRFGETTSSHLAVELTEPDSVNRLTDWLNCVEGHISGVIHCVGQLHDNANKPEKNLKQLNRDWLLSSMSVNVMTHVHLAQAITPMLTRTSSFRWMSLSAKVGSIEDNGLGGWYSYRMSKAALNMFVRNLSIEWGRQAPLSSVVAVHPGTTPSDLSEPFIANWPKEKCYQPELTAQRMITIFEGLKPEHTGKLFHHDGSVIPW